MLGSVFDRLLGKPAERKPRDPYAKYRAAGVKIGQRCHIYGTIFDQLVPFLVEIGDDVSLAGNVAILSHDASLIHTNNQGRFAKTYIKDRVFVGRSSIILPGVTIGPDSIVGAGSVVTRDVPPGEVWAGNPARRICTIQEMWEKAQKRPHNRWVPMVIGLPEDPDYPNIRKEWGERLRKLHKEGHFD